MQLNIYYHPEKFSLEPVAELETGRSYEFETTVVWKRDDGKFFWAQDSGCSCPTPFEGMGFGSDVESLNLNTFDEFKKQVNEFHKSYEGNNKENEKTGFFGKIFEALIKERGNELL